MISDIFAVKKVTPRIRSCQVNEVVQRRSLSCTIRTQQANHLTLADLQVQGVHNLPSPVRLAKVDGLEFEHIPSFLDLVQRQRSQTFRRFDVNAIIAKKEGQLTPLRCVS